MYNLGWFWAVRGDPRSSTMSPFDSAPMTSYSSVVETIQLSCTILELQ